MIGLMINARVLASRLADLLRRERAAMAEFLVALAEFDRQRSWADLGYPSLFDFLHRELGVSAGAAHYRKTAAELIRRAAPRRHHRAPASPAATLEETGISTG